MAITHAVAKFICTIKISVIIVLVIIFIVSNVNIWTNKQSFIVYVNAATAADTFENVTKKISSGGVDKFGIKEIYPTKQGGREWFLNMNNPDTNNSDTAFSITASQNHELTKQNDSSWSIGGRGVRLNVDTPLLAVPWKNIEITGYVKVLSKVITTTTPTTNSSQNNITGSNNNNDTSSVIERPLDKDSSINWYARGDRHSSRFPCEGTAYHGILHIDGTAGWEKEIWHTGGYTSERDKVKVTNDSSIIGRWIGWKVVMYNIKNDTQVKLESYLDDKNNNNWVKVTDLIDNGGWYSTALDKEFYSANCGKVKDYIITNSGPIATFRSDNVVWDFKNLSIREIQPPS